MRVKLVADDGREFILTEFNEWFAQLPEPARLYIVTTGTINHTGCEAFWEWLCRDDAVPKSLKVFVDKDDFERAFPATRRH